MSSLLPDWKTVDLMGSGEPGFCPNWFNDEAL